MTVGPRQLDVLARACRDGRVTVDRRCHDYTSALRAVDAGLLTRFNDDPGDSYTFFPTTKGRALASAHLTGDPNG